MKFVDRFHDAQLELILEGLPFCGDLQDICRGLLVALESDCMTVAEDACLGLHRIAAENMAIALCLEQAATLAEARLARRA